MLSLGENPFTALPFSSVEGIGKVKSCSYSGRKLEEES